MNVTSKIIGIVNLTPDSFSKTGRYFDHVKALDYIKDIIAKGVDVIDIGAESTRPGSVAVAVEEEMRRLEILSKIKELVLGTKVKISLDSRNYATISRYIDYIDIINDVSGFHDRSLLDLALNNNKKIVLMHSLSVPVIKGQYIQTDDIILYLKKWLSQRLDELCELGFSRDQIIFDPGIGFGTTPEQSFTIIKNIKSFMDCGVEILVGHSKKSFLSVLGEEDPNNRAPETNAMTLYLAQACVNYIRVHDVWDSKRIINLAEALR